MGSTKLGRVVLFAKDLDTLRRFYRDCLGLDEVSADAGFVVLGSHGAELALHAVPEEVAARIEIETPPEARENTPIKPVFAVDDIDELRERIPESGGLLRQTRSFGKRRLCDATDPEGNVFQLVDLRGS
jgi:predicted enzyme related to lactoylglutathione lyase